MLHRSLLETVSLGILNPTLPPTEYQLLRRDMIINYSYHFTINLSHCISSLKGIYSLRDLRNIIIISNSGTEHDIHFRRKQEGILRAPGEENLVKPLAQSEDPWPLALDHLTSCLQELSVEAANLPSLPLVFSM